ncbi:MAG: TonB-dependent receptor [Desulfarculus sp.]|nr:TonB-dependent receptor [Desulfarculus sp.]
MRKLSLILIMLGLAGPVAASGASGDPGATPAPGQAATLAPVTVTAKRQAAAFLDTAAATTTLEREEIELMAGDSALDLVEQTAGVFISAQLPGGVNQGGMNGEAGLRGLKGGELVLLNGLPILASPANGGYDLAMIPKRMIERIEIVKGAQAVLYGSQAMSGVINVITRQPTAAEGKTQAGADAKAGNRDRWQAGVWGDHPLAWVGGQAGGQGALDQVKVNYSTRSPYNTNLKRVNEQAALVATRPLPWLSLNYMLNRQESGYTRSYGKSPASDYQTDQKLTHNYLWGGVDRPDLRLMGFLHYSHMDLGYDYDALNKPNREEEKHHQSLGLDGQRSSRLGPVNLVYGLRYVYERQHDIDQDLSGSDRAGYRVVESYVNHHRHQGSLFAMAEWEPGPDWLLSAGLRGEAAFNTEQNSDDHQEALPQLSALYRLSKQQSLYANLGRTFRLPTFTQLYSTSATIGGNPDLGPERGWTYELGWKTADKSYSASLALFHMAYTDKVRYIYNDAQERYIAQNLDKWQSTGVEAQVKLALGGGFWLELGGYWADPWEEDGGVEKQSGPKLQAVPGLSWRGQRLQAGVNAVFQLEREDNLDDYCNLRGRASYRLTDWCRLELEADNLLDKRLVVDGNMTPGASSNYEVYHPGLNVFAGVSFVY